MDITALLSDVQKEIILDDTINLEEEIYQDSEIVYLNPVSIKGKITKNALMELQIELEATGTMILKDSISLEEVEYPFSFQLDRILEENDKKDENTLDLMNILWENIILEIPLKFTKVEDLSKFHGDGWKLVSEDDLKRDNNPFSDLLKEFGEE